MLLTENSVFQKLEGLDHSLNRAIEAPESIVVPYIPGRDIEYLPISFLKGRMGLATDEGKIKLLHDLANIELQAMELGYRTLVEFSWAPEEFKQRLIEIIREEAKHLKLCLQGIESLGGQWGQFPVHLGLWHSTHKKDSLLERIFIVHRYLEGSGLDAGDTLLRRLSGVGDKKLNEIVKVIVDEEVGHVSFGSQWYKHYIDELKIDEQDFFQRMCVMLMKKHPRKDKISSDLRRQAQFNDVELGVLNEIRKS